MMDNNETILSIKNLMMDFRIGHSKSNLMRAVNDVSFDLKKGEALAIVGESGSGKSTGARILTRIYKETGGSITFKGKPLADYVSEYGELEYARQVQMIFQDPFSSLNPVHNILHHIARPLLIHKRATKQNVTEKVIALLELVGLSPAVETAEKFPHELSGGQRQRVAIARALVNNPSIILADEPTGNLDSKTSYGIMELFHELHAKGNTIIMVTHEDDIAHYAHRVVRLRDGLVESDKVNPNPTRGILTTA